MPVSAWQSTSVQLLIIACMILWSRDKLTKIQTCVPWDIYLYQPVHLQNITNPANVLLWNFWWDRLFCVYNRFTLISRPVKANGWSSNTVINHSLGKYFMVFLNAAWSVNPPGPGFWTFSHIVLLLKKLSGLVQIFMRMLHSEILSAPNLNAI